jgi:hypothetical protein
MDGPERESAVVRLSISSTSPSTTICTAVTRLQDAATTVPGEAYRTSAKRRRLAICAGLNKPRLRCADD